MTSSERPPREPGYRPPGRSSPSGGRPSRSPRPEGTRRAKPRDRRAGPSPSARPPASGGRVPRGVPPDARRRRPAPPQPSRGAFARRRVLAGLVLFAGVLLVWFLVALFQPFAGQGKGEGRIVVTVPDGANASQVAEILSDEGVISSGSLFQLRLRLSGESGSILPGRYLMASGMSYSTAIDRLTGESADGLITLTIPEGLPRSQVAPIVSDVGIQGDYAAATESFKGFDPAKYGAEDPPSLEGFLFPATYELEPGASVDDLVFQQLDAFRQNLDQVDLAYAKKKNLTPYDILIIASMIDREVVVPKERPLVAAVIYNRLRIGEPLGIDATTRYEYDSYTEPLTSDQLETDTPYNTRLNAGLPPTPIGNPGLASMQAAARPAKVDYLYYVVDPDGCGTHSFTASADEFNRLVAEYNAAREAAGGQAPSNCGGGQ
ncbi:MAG: endolytic transglycosylase MltG [bacterium]